MVQKKEMINTTKRTEEQKMDRDEEREMLEQ
jgi:hypothetical protein